MKVLMFGWEFPPHISGGLGTACYGLTKGLISIGDIDLTFVVPKAFGDEDKSRMNIVGASDVEVSTEVLNHEEFLRNINFLHIQSNLIPYVTPEQYAQIMTRKDIGQYPIHTGFSGKLNFSGGYGHNLFQEIANYAIVAATIASKDHYDVIHAHDWLTYPAGIAAKKITGKPLIVHVHATDFDRSGGNVNPTVYDIERQGMHYADMVITVSNFTRNIVIEKYGIHPDKVVTIHNAVDPLQHNYWFDEVDNKPEKIVTFLGRVTLQKGPEYFIETAHKVLQKMDNVRFVMAGSGDMLDRMVERVASLRIGDKFNFAGFLKGEDVYRMFFMSDVYVMPSISEPFGISPLEAIQSNVPVIISKQSGVSEVLKHAIKVDFWDIDATADAIYGLLNYKGIRKMFRKHGPEEVNTLKWENTAMRIRDIYYSLINKK